MPKIVPVVDDLCLYEVEAIFEEVGVFLCRGNVDRDYACYILVRSNPAHPTPHFKDIDFERLTRIASVIRNEVRRRNIAGDCPMPSIHLGSRRFYFEETYR